MSISKPNRFLYLLRYARPYKRQVALQFLFMGISVAMGVARPWPLKVLVDNVVGRTPLDWWGWSAALAPGTLLLFSCLAYVLLQSGESLISFGSTTVATLTSSRMTRDLRADLVRSLHALSLKFHDSHRVGDLVHRVAYNTSAVETAFQSGFMGAIKSAVTLMSLLVIMLAMNLKLTLVAVVIIPVLLLSIRRYARRIQAVSRMHQDQEGRVSSRLQEMLTGIRLVQAFNRESSEQSRFDQLAHGSVGTRMRMTVLQGAFGFSVALTLAIGTALLFWMGIQEVLAEQLTIGEFLVFNAYLAMLYAPLSVLSYTASSVQSALGGGARLFEILEAVNEVADAPAAAPLEVRHGHIRFEGVSFAYESRNPVLHDVSFEVEPGHMLAIVGETGSGKSTLLTLLLRFYNPTEGRILVDGQDLRSRTLRSLRDHVSLVPQEAILFSDSIRENIGYGKATASEEEILEAAKMAQADEFISQLAEGYDTEVGERGVRLSVGQRQRIGLARAFLRNALILLLDEPTSALDAETEARLMHNIESFARNKTVITVAHRLSTVRSADQILVLHRGRIVESGDHQTLMTLHGHYFRLWHAQHGEKTSAVTVEEP